MIKAKVYSQAGKENGEIGLPESIFGVEVNYPLVHQVIKSYLANKRQGTAKAKTRAEVSGGGRKPYRQKGTGRARAGSNTSPVWVRGGKAFGPTPRSYGGTIPQMLRHTALKSAYTIRAQEEKVLVVEEYTLSQPKTQDVVAFLKEMSLLHKKNLFIIGDEDRNVYLSGRNIKNMQVVHYADVNAYDIINSENILFAKKTLIEKVEEVIG